MKVEIESKFEDGQLLKWGQTDAWKAGQGLVVDIKLVKDGLGLHYFKYLMEYKNKERRWIPEDCLKKVYLEV